MSGLSPPVRGSPCGATAISDGTGSIPARAGKPTNFIGIGITTGVYPRPCGEASSAEFLPRNSHGLSPPVRGSLPVGPRRRSADGSIPARAGKPTASDGTLSATVVYPRPCGEAIVSAGDRNVISGLSPPVRGSRWSTFTARPCWRSIPARAGKPSARRPSPFSDWVYPRPCGEACEMSEWASWTQGLSPPVRGSPRWSVGLRRGQRSIPARAGKPACHDLPFSHVGVYPRPCGEAVTRSIHCLIVAGLSPPVRGSHLRTAHRCARFRSIPARAGKPLQELFGCQVHAVYPRPCGEAPSMRR